MWLWRRQRNIIRPGEPIWSIQADKEDQDHEETALDWCGGWSTDVWRIGTGIFPS
jgi:hypothetical protein